MKMAQVVGVLQVANVACGYETACWVQLRTEQGVEVALDPIGVKAGQTVVYARGTGAEHYRMEGRFDAVIMAVVAGTGEK